MNCQRKECIDDNVEEDEPKQDICASFQEKLNLECNSNGDDNRKEEISLKKQHIRNLVWKELQDKNLVEDYPPSCFQKIPHFIHCKKAAHKASCLREFSTSQVIKINPSLAQMHLRFLSLINGKTLLVPNPSLDGEFFYLLNLEGEPIDKRTAHQSKSKAGAKKHGEHLLDDWSKVCHIDLYVVGSVAVSFDGTRLGKGMGYAELEWGILWELGKVTRNTTVITTVHEQQVLPESKLNKSLATNHDLPVDIIVTPRRIIPVRKPQPKPECGILWDLLSHDTIQSMPILKILLDQRRKNK